MRGRLLAAADCSRLLSSCRTMATCTRLSRAGVGWAFQGSARLFSKHSGSLLAQVGVWVVPVACARAPATCCGSRSTCWPRPPLPASGLPRAEDPVLRPAGALAEPGYPAAVNQAWLRSFLTYHPPVKQGSARYKPCLSQLCSHHWTRCVAFSATLAGLRHSRMHWLRPK